MKFTIDTENNKILFHEPFTIEDLQHVLSLINIDGVEEWKVDMSDDYLSNRLPNDIWQNPNIITYPNWGGDYTDPYQPPFIITSSDIATGTITLTGNTGTITYGSTTTGEITFNNSTDTLSVSSLEHIYNLND